MTKGTAFAYFAADRGCMDRAAGWIIKELKTVFKISLTVLVFMCGILIGKEVEGKSGGKPDDIQVKGNLYIRGSGNILHRKIELHNE